MREWQRANFTTLTPEHLQDRIDLLDAKNELVDKRDEIKELKRLLRAEREENQLLTKQVQQYDKEQRALKELKTKVHGLVRSGEKHTNKRAAEIGRKPGDGNEKEQLERQGATLRETSRRVLVAESPTDVAKALAAQLEYQTNLGLQWAGKITQAREKEHEKTAKALKQASKRLDDERLRAKEAETKRLRAEEAKLEALQNVENEVRLRTEEATKAGPCQVEIYELDHKSDGEDYYVPSDDEYVDEDRATGEFAEVSDDIADSQKGEEKRQKQGQQLDEAEGWLKEQEKEDGEPTYCTKCVPGSRKLKGHVGQHCKKVRSN